MAALGRVAGAAERALYRDSRPAGVIFATGLVGGAAVAGVLLDRAERIRPITVALVAWSVLGGRTLVRVGERMAQVLDHGDLDAGRALVPSLCGRDPSVLDESGMARAALESIAENTSDATVAPLFWGAVAGLPGLLAYRTVNTLDAMVGYRNERYRQFGWAAARLDDVANLVPARLTGVAACVLGGRPTAAWAAWRRDAAGHPSPNAGVVEASFAGALGVTLGGPTEYPHGVEERPRLGSGSAPVADDLRRGAALSRRIQRGAAVLAVVVALARRRQSP